MSNHESGGERQVEQSKYNRVRLTLAFASIALVGSLTACTVAAENYNNRPRLPERNAPAEQSYALNADDAYYDRIAAVKAQTDDPETIRWIDALVDQPIAEWLLDDTSETFGMIKETLAEAGANKTIPVFVAYDIPNRDLGSHSAGGEENAQQYRDWTNQVSQAIGASPAVIILEPDALAQLPDMNQAQADERMDLLADALDAYQANQNTAVYLDIGNSKWLAPDEAAGFMKEVAERSTGGIQGISLNVSNFRSEKETSEYAAAVQDAYGQLLYVMIDNSRNGAPGAVAPDDWCNPAGQRIGSADHTFDPTGPVEATFIKAPGESDGKCGISTLAAGAFDSALLLRQLGQ